MTDKKVYSKPAATSFEWMPLPMQFELAQPDPTSSRIRRVKYNATKRDDILTKLRNTWFGRVYTNQLKRYAVVRWVFQWIWCHGYPIYVNHIVALISHASKRRAIRWRPLIKLAAVSEKMGTSIYKLADEAVIDTPDPIVFPRCEQGFLISPHDRFKFPKISVVIISNGMIYGGSNLALTADNVICHDLYDFERDYTSEELHGRTLIDPKNRRIRWLLHDDEPERIHAAASFVDACAPNYAHWLTEVLPRVAIFCSDERFKSIPIVVNEGLHKNIMESLFLITGPEREIILLPIGRGLHCDDLYITSASGYVPFEWRKNRDSHCSHGVFSPLAFDLMRKHLGRVKLNTRNQTWPKKLFLRRNSGYRNVVNAVEIEKLFCSHGYVVVEPEKLTFLQQVALFSNAKFIVSSSGAALANIIFASQDVKVFILISKHPDTIYWYWQNIACVSGKTVNYVLGKIDENEVSGIHASFEVDLDDLEPLISEIEECNDEPRQDLLG